jgi:hypothetical protein
MNLDNIEWGVFEIGKIFSIENCKCSNVSLLENGNIPYVGATNRNNGVLKFVKPDKKLITKGNCIAFICDGEGSVGYSIYKSEDFIGSTTVKVGRNNNLNKYTASFIITIADTVRSKYNFGFKRNETHLKKERILLPINIKKEPDFEFMEHYMRQKKNEKIAKFQKHFSTRTKQINDFKEVETLDEKEFGEFEIGKLFKLFPGKSKGLNHLEKNNSGINYLGATNTNNGVLAYVNSNGNEKMIQKGNSIAFIRNGEGSMGFSIYKAEDFIATSDISVGYSEKLNREIGLFITTVADQIRGKYNFGYKRSDTRLKKEKLKLPIDKKGQPDYEYMENFIKKIEYEKLTKYIERKTTNA